MTDKYVCIHGHFYQPPRENPWLEEVEFEESALPYHDWNTRITAECYAPNSVCRIMDPEGRIIGLVNNYTKISFNFGPTLLSWIEKHDPTLYQAILDADKQTVERFSAHGSAIAQVYNHMIMPLANRRDKETQVKWAIRDFEVRYGRFPEGIWLPETAVDVETLEVFAENGVKFTILSPHQAYHTRKMGEEKWEEVSQGKMNVHRAYLCNLPSKKAITIFFYDLALATDASFGDMLANGEVFANGLIKGFRDKRENVALVSLASDGELYGHHRSHGDMTLAYCLYSLETKKMANITNFAEFLAKHPPQHEVEIRENTSWSCSHGVERWRSDCGDNTGQNGWRQLWRKPLRETMDWLRDTLAPPFEQEAQKFLKEPWQARNDYVNVVLDRSRGNVEKFLSEHSNKNLEDNEKRRVLRLLEMQRHAMLMFTSCGWFFDDISGIESRQVMMYAARAMQLANELFGLQLEGEFVKRMEQAPSNIPEFGNGARVYEVFVKPAMSDAAKISAQRIILALFAKDLNEPLQETSLPGCCLAVTHEKLERHDNGRFRLVLGRSRVHSDITLDDEEFGGAAIWLGDHNVSCGVARDMDEEKFDLMRKEILDSFEKVQINETILLISKHFGQNTYSLKDMFKDDQQRILNFIVEEAVKKARELYEIVYHDNSAMLRFMNDVNIVTPKPFRVAAEVVLNMKVQRVLSSEEGEIEQLKKAIKDLKNLNVKVDSEGLSLEASERIAKQFAKFSENPESLEEIDKICSLIEAINELPLKLNLWHSQNVAFKIAEAHYQDMKQRTDEASQKWVSEFRQLCELIRIRLD